MAFKTLKDYNNEKFAGKFRLMNNGDSADVIILYRSEDDVIVCDSHYIKSASYTGYVNCSGVDCPACASGIRKTMRIFVPVYNISTNQIEFWDRKSAFYPQHLRRLFEMYPNPSECVFRITREGDYGDRETQYRIDAIAKNTYKSYDEIMKQFNVTFPDYFNSVCKDISSQEMSKLIDDKQSSSQSTVTEMPDYTITPRGLNNTEYQPNDSVDIDNIPYEPNNDETEKW